MEKLICTACGAPLTPDTASPFLTCEYCDTSTPNPYYSEEAAEKAVQPSLEERCIGKLLEMLYRGEQAGDPLCREAIDTLLLQQVDHKLNGRICGEVRIAHKTGEDDNLSNDVGVVYAREPFVICFAGHDTDVYAWEDLMRRGAHALLRAQD